ncbi:MAG: hypothetical protein KDD10_09950 [Phaeodactylibacter sp.]|nr:hypothetical protein [Phaeodactylibacter sp.]
MDYFDTINSSKESELAYANWYSRLPDERKAKMLCDLFQFGIETIKYNAKKENPFLTESELLLLYMEFNLKDAYPPETFAFIRKKMLERAEEEWKQRFRAMKKELSWTYEEMARFMGASSGDSLKASVSRKLPGFAKLAVCVFEKMKEEGQKGNNPENVED